MKINTIAFIIIIIGATLGMLFLSNNYRNERLKLDEQEIKGKNVLQVIIDSTKNKDPFFNVSLKGKTIVLNVWVPNLASCRKQIPELNKLVKDFASDKIVFAAISPGDSAVITNAIKEYNIKFDYPLLFGKKELIRLFFSLDLIHNAYESPFPINMVINSEGRIELFYTGDHPENLENIRNYLMAVSGKM